MLTTRQFKLIGPTIRSVANALAPVYFKRETNTQERAEVVFSIIRQAALLALYDNGISLEEIEQQVDPTVDIVLAMKSAGFKITEPMPEAIVRCN